MTAMAATSTDPIANTKRSFRENSIRRYSEAGLGLMLDIYHLVSGRLSVQFSGLFSRCAFRDDLTASVSARRMILSRNDVPITSNNPPSTNTVTGSILTESLSMSILAPYRIAPQVDWLMPRSTAKVSRTVLEVSLPVDLVLISATGSVESAASDKAGILVTKNRTITAKIIVNSRTNLARIVLRVISMSVRSSSAVADDRHGPQNIDATGITPGSAFTRQTGLIPPRVISRN